jgi:ACS family pantothenate transporter-like MFS transporter
MAVGQLPHGIVIQKIAPRLWFPSMVVIWAILTVFYLSYHSLVKLRC